MEKSSKIYIAGHKGMVGSAIWRALESKGYTNLIGRTSKELDLRNQQQVQAFFQTEKPDVVIDAAARVGGILANNNYPYTFLMENMQIQNNLIQTALDTDVQKFVFLGSSCIYPKLAPQPLQEECLLTSSLEPTNEWYAIAKISGVKACESIRKQFNKDFVSLMPTNLYGSNDNFDLSNLNVRKLEIFNRYGLQVYSKTNYVDEWKGQTNNGDLLPSATYYYAIELENGEPTKTGWIYLIRDNN